jgi:hypothetical protein
MERDVVKPLDVPGWQTKQSSEPAPGPAPENTAAAAPVKGGLRLEDWLPNRSAGAGTSAATDISTATSDQRELERCPHCGARLSPIDIKLNVCMSCHKDIVAGAAPKSRRPGDFFIRL